MFGSAGLFRMVSDDDGRLRRVRRGRLGGNEQFSRAEVLAIHARHEGIHFVLRSKEDALSFRLIVGKEDAREANELIGGTRQYVTPGL